MWYDVLVAYAQHVMSCGMAHLSESRLKPRLNGNH